MKEQGKIIAISGPVVDVEFEKSANLPRIKEALSTKVGNELKVMEVAQHIGSSIVRCIMLSGSEGLNRDMIVERDGFGIRVPVGDVTLGRMFNVLGIPIDKGSELDPNVKNG